MAIHHDSHAYGNLEKLKSDMSEEELLKMLSLLNSSEEEDKDEKGENKDK